MIKNSRVVYKNRITVRSMILVSLFAALTAIGAFIKIPIPFVPFTLQLMFCCFAGILLGSKLGTVSQILYVSVGLAGVPVFANGGGPSYIFQPSFGYLIGFIVAAYVIGKLTENINKLTFKRAILSVLAGVFFIYLFGVSYLYFAYNVYLNNPQTIKWAVYYGFSICIGGDLILSVIVAVTACKVLPIIKKAGFINN